MVFTRRTPPMNIHIASSCGSESFIEVDLLRSFRVMVHSLVAELFRTVNEEGIRSVSAVSLQDKGMKLLPGLSSTFLLHLKLHNDKHAILLIIIMGQSCQLIEKALLL